MRTTRRKFSKDEKLSIIKEAGEQGVNAMLEKHGIYPATYYSWKNKFESMGEEGLNHGMTQPQLKRIRELEKENQMLKELVAEKELEGRLKDELLKKQYALEKKKKIISRYIFQGMRRNHALLIASVSKHQYYYQPTGRKPGRKASSSTPKDKGEIISNTDVVMKMEEIKMDSTTDYGYTKMTYQLKT